MSTQVKGGAVGSPENFCRAAWMSLMFTIPLGPDQVPVKTPTQSPQYLGAGRYTVSIDNAAE